MLKPEVKQWMKAVASDLPVPKFRERVDPHVHDICLDVRYFAPDRRTRDTDNVQKIFRDILQQAWSVDDSRFLVREQSYEVDSGDPRIEIEVTKGEIRESESIF